ncbi:MAG: lysophospholipid acyltransferase family protein [Myxococcota bacterium]|nr:lysophospholipid acyltransferase family protein [Myxococcota bacterium]
MSASVARHLKDLATLALYAPGRPLLARLNRSGLDSLAGGLSGLSSRVGLKNEAVAREELELSFGTQPLPRPMEEILADAWRLALFNELEVLRYPELSRDTVDEVCEVVGFEHLDQALSLGKGAIVLIGHYGANQMIMPALGHNGYAMSQLSAPPTVWAEILKDTRTTAAYERVLQRRWELEQRLPVRHINVFRFMRPALECLHRNEVLGLAFDGGGGRSWTGVSLLGRAANVSIQPAQLARKTGAAILPTRVWRSPGMTRHVIEIDSPLSCAEEGPDAIAMDMQAYADRFSAWVRERPEQYLPFLVVRREMRGLDVRPFFDDYPDIEGGGLNPEEAALRLQQAAERSGALREG